MLCDQKHICKIDLSRGRLSARKKKEKEEKREDFLLSFPCPNSEMYYILNYNTLFYPNLTWKLSLNDRVPSSSLTIKAYS